MGPGKNSFIVRWFRNQLLVGWGDFQLFRNFDMPAASLDSLLLQKTIYKIIFYVVSKRHAILGPLHFVNSKDTGQYNNLYFFLFETLQKKFSYPLGHYSLLLVTRDNFSPEQQKFQSSLILAKKTNKVANFFIS